MKKFLLFTLMAGMMAFVVPSIEANTLASSAMSAPQIRVQIGGRRNRGPVRTITRTRIAREGRFTYRETVRITYFANGRTREQVISRVRVGGRRNY